MNMRMISRALGCALIALAVEAASAAGQQASVNLVAGTSQALRVAPGGQIAIPIVLDMSRANGGAVSSVGGFITWDPTYVHLDSLLPSSFGSINADLTGVSLGSVSFSISSPNAASSTTTLAIAYFTGGSVVGGSRIAAAGLSAGNLVGTLSPWLLNYTYAHLCVAPGGNWGDANGDASVDIIDAQQIARYEIGLSVANPSLIASNGDVNGDNVVNIIDAQQIARYSVSLPAAARINTAVYTPAPVATIIPSRTTAAYNLGTPTGPASRTYTATPLDAAGNSLIGCAPVTWNTDNAAVATVGASGSITVTGAGTAHISATAGSQTTQTTVTVSVPDTNAVMLDLRNVTAGGTATTTDGAWLLGGLMADEWRNADTFGGRIGVDQRNVTDRDGTVSQTLTAINKTHADAAAAITALVASGGPNGSIGHMYFVLGYSELLLAENFCNGIYLNDASSGLLLNGPSKTNAAVYALAIAHFDTALTLVAGNAAYTNLASVAKGRAQIEIGQSSAAATTVSSVPTSYQDLSTLASSGESNKLWTFNSSQKRYSVDDTSNQVGPVINALPFVSRPDPRVSIATGGTSFDGFTTPFATQLDYLQATATPLLNGIDARLIEAEAQLVANNFAGMTAILNALRTTTQQIGAVTVSPMAPLSTPGTATAARQMLFAERAYWTFGRGQRLGDLRRLIRQYGQTDATTFPSGGFHKGGGFGTLENLPAAVDESGAGVGSVCIDRNP